jgi:TRAP-type C4-dicarboxylate transport system permease small subunit
MTEKLMMKTGLDRLSGVVIAIAALALVGLVAVQGWQVFARYVLNDSPSWTEPVTMVLLTSAMSFGAASGVYNDRHFAFTLLADAAPPKLRRGLFIFTKLIIALLGAVLAWWSLLLFRSGIDVRAAGAAFPESLPYVPVALGGVLMVVFALARCLSTPTVAASATTGEEQ